MDWHPILYSEWNRSLQYENLPISRKPMRIARPGLIFLVWRKEWWSFARTLLARTRARLFTSNLKLNSYFLAIFFLCWLCWLWKMCWINWDATMTNLVWQWTNAMLHAHARYIIICQNGENCQRFVTIFLKSHVHNSRFDRRWDRLRIFWTFRYLQTGSFPPAD